MLDRLSSAHQGMSHLVSTTEEYTQHMMLMRTLAANECSCLKKDEKEKWLWQWAFCNQLSHGTKFTMQDGKLCTGTIVHPIQSKIKLQWLISSFVRETVVFFCHPAWWIVYHVTIGCKRPVRLVHNKRILNKSMEGEFN